jgi:hypothetical protein
MSETEFPNLLRRAGSGEALALKELFLQYGAPDGRRVQFQRAIIRVSCDLGLETDND